MTSRMLDRSGIFKARPVSWKVKTFANSNSVAIAVEMSIVAQLEGQDWIDWRDFDEHRVWGDWFVVKKDGSPNIDAVQQLAVSLAWGGSLREIASNPPPDCLVQVTVKEETYNGKTYFKGTWLNHGDFQPTPGGADENEVNALDAKFGSLLRAAAAKKPAGTKPKPAAKPATAVGAKSDPTGIEGHGNPDGIPF